MISKGSEVMNKETLVRPTIIVAIIVLLTITSSYSIYRGVTYSSGAISLATWSVTLNQEGVNDELTIVPVNSNDTYELNITSTSNVDINYTIKISNLPAGVQVTLDNGAPVSQDNNNIITFTDAGRILYNDVNKTKSHILTFSAVANTTPVNSQTVSIDVIAKQILNS